MRILINALSARLGGGQTYLINLLKFIPSDVNAEIFVLAPDSLELPVSNGNITRIKNAWPLENPFLRTIWEKAYLPRLSKKLNVDVVFYPGGVISTKPHSGCKTVTMFRNMIPFDMTQRKKYPLGYQRVRNWILQRIMLRSMLHADLVIFISQFAKKIIEKYAGRPLKNAVIIPHGISPHFRVNQTEYSHMWSQLFQHQYLLYVSTLDVYKAQIEVVRAYALLKKMRDTNEKLVLAGPERTSYGKKVRSEIERLGLTSDIFLVGSIPYDRLPSLYHNALVNIFASESENCPNILLEALAAGRPVLSSNRPPMPEFAGDAAIYFDPRSPEDLADKLASLITDSARMEELSTKAKNQSLRYDWNVTAQQTWDAIQALSNGKN